ncbi:MAG: S8 family serine peptidase [Gammaproteobacteria bacterium]|nr:S8 family serine peptidase [Gammaproteobacteria bacterium]
MESRDAGERERAGDKLDWLGSPGSIEALLSQASHAGRDWSFGWIRLAPGASADDLARVLPGVDAGIVGSAGSLIRARLPGDKARLRAIWALSEVDGIGAAPTEVKLRAVEHEMSAIPASEQIPVFVTLMTGDPDGKWRRALEAFGAVVGQFDPSIRVYAANATHDVLQDVALADFVMAIEPVGIVEAAHDTSVPAMGADALRVYEGSPGLFSGVGGASVPIAVMDGGLNVNHLDISSNRSSICGANFVYYDPLVDDEDLWVDAGMHGTHVTGTMVGNGTVQPRYAGMAPLVQHIRFAKVLSHFGRGNDIFILRGMDFLAESTACPESGWSSDPVKPLIVNMSLSASALFWEGRSVAERKLDATVWDRRQLYVVAQSNSDIHGFSNYASAKNSLAVGAVMDGGSLAAFSSHGPTADGRLAPQVVGAGVGLNSTAGDGSRGGYLELSGTSMASPAVAGVAALLLDAVPAHRDRPALARARLMASAIKPDAWMEDAEVFPSDNSSGPGLLQTQYGLGKVSARTSVLNRDQPDGWTSGSVISELETANYAYHDIHVPEGTSRLDLVLTWDEPPTDTLASTVLNDLDLWLDLGGDCEAEPCGEYASLSRADNVEWIIVRKPAPGTYRAKVAATRVYTDPPRAALAWTTIRGASTPNLEISLDKETLEFDERYDEAELAVTLTADEYVAAGTRLQIDCRRADGSGCPRKRIWYSDRGRSGMVVTMEREDGLVQEVGPYLGGSIEVGELAAGETWKAKVNFLFDTLAENDAEAFRLYFKASAWNANPDSVSVLVRMAGTDETLPETAVPANDGFAGAAPISGNEGTAELDLIGAQAEPGEPLFSPRLGRPAGSVWYEWTAPSDDMVSFSVTPDAAYGSTDTVRVDVFRGDRIAALEPVASSDWGVQFFADSGRNYRIRVGHVGAVAPLVMNWSSGSRPANDDFAAATVLEDADGSTEGTNAGATLESGEFFGDLAATVWYQWTAPGDGAWEFESSAEDLCVLAFAGTSLSDLRLVSGFGSDRAVFPARGGETYRIAVASRNADAAGARYELTWEAIDRESGNDDFAGAEEIPGEASSSHGIGIDEEATVEPGEPAESGIRTKWWSWTAPSDGRYTWRLEELTRPTGSLGSRLMVSVFAGDELEDLEMVSTNGVGMSVEFAFSAEGGRRYWLSAGMPANDQWAFTSRSWRAPDATLAWGPAPDNDDATGAASLSGASGSIAGSNAFATGARGERSDILGRSTLWWTYEAASSGWVRFAVEGDGGPWALTVHRDSSNGPGGLEILASDRWQRNENEVLFEARPGVRYTIALGVRGGGQGSEFTLRWEESEDPGWLRFSGKLADGDRDSQGSPVEIRNPGDLAVDDSGGALYLGSGIGLQVFERDLTTGGLDHVQLLETDFDLVPAALLWDSRRDRLLATACGTWWAFARDGDGPDLEDSGELAAEEDPGGCADHREQLLLDSDGSNIYRVRRSRIDHFAVEDGGTFRFVQSVSPGGVLRAVLSNDEKHVYVATSNELRVYERDAESGELAETDFSETISGLHAPPVPVAVTDDDAYLFVFDNDGERANLFSLENPLNPDSLASFSRYEEPFQLNRCRFADARSETVVVDVFCPGMAFAVRWDVEAGQLELTDSLIEGEADRFNVLTPNFGAPNFGAPTGFAVSPDDRYVYLSTPHYGILIIGRATPPATDKDDGSDSEVGS